MSLKNIKIKNGEKMMLTECDGTVTIQERKNHSTVKAHIVYPEPLSKREGGHLINYPGGNES